MKKRMTALCICLMLLSTLLGCHRQETSVATDNSNKSSVTITPGENKSDIQTPTEPTVEKSNTKKSDKKDCVKGRYITETIEFPKEIVDRCDLDTMYISEYSKDGLFDLYYTDHEFRTFLQVTYTKELKWKVTELNWPKKISANGGWIQDMTTGEDGISYLLYFAKTKKGNLLPHVVKESSDTSYEEIAIEDYKEKNNISEYPYPHTIEVDEEGTIYAQDDDSFSSYDQKTGKKKYSQDTNPEHPWILLNEDQIYVGNRDQTIPSYQKSSGEPMDTYQFTSKQPNAIKMCMNSDNQLSILIPEGIYGLLPDNTWEQVVDNKLTPIPASCRSFIAGQKNDYYIITYNNTLTHYYYSEDVSALPEKTLSIYSMVNSSIVQQAIVLYMKDHPDVQVSYQPVTENIFLNQLDEIPESTMEDYVKSLNTQLVAKDACDILFVDHLPYENMMAKDVFANLYDYVPGLKENTNILQNVRSSFERDGKLYVFPTIMSVYGYNAPEDVVQSMTSTHDLCKDIVDNNRTTLFSTWNIYQFLDLILQMESERLMVKDQLMSEDEMVELFEDLRTIQEHTKDGLVEKNFTDDGNYYYGSQEKLQLQSKDVFLGAELSNVVGLSDLADLVEKRKGHIYNIKQQYIPKMMVGINQSSENKEIAGEFLSYFYKENTNFMDIADGVSVTESALKYFLEDEQDNMTYGSNAHFFSYASKEMRQEYVDLMKSATQASVMDYKLYPIYRETFAEFLLDDEDAETAGKKLYNQVKLFQWE